MLEVGHLTKVRTSVRNDSISDSRLDNTEQLLDTRQEWRRMKDRIKRKKILKAGCTTGQLLDRTGRSNANYRVGIVMITNTRDHQF